MSLGPDIIVADPQGLAVSLVVETRLSPRVGDAEEQLKAWMVGRRCPTGMIVTSEELALYRDTWRGLKPGSIERLGPFRLPGSLVRSLPAQLSDAEFAMLVQDWLEKLGAGRIAIEDPQLPAALDEVVRPALLEGEIRAGGPRWYRMAE